LLILRIVGVFTGLLLAGLVLAWTVTRNARYLRIASRVLQVVLLLGVAAGLLYVFERVLLL
jgi:hypothetical protein